MSLLDTSLLIANLCYAARWLVTILYPTHAHGTIVNYCPQIGATYLSHPSQAIFYFASVIKIVILSLDRWQPCFRCINVAPVVRRLGEFWRVIILIEDPDIDYAQCGQVLVLAPLACEGELRVKP